MPEPTKKKMVPYTEAAKPALSPNGSNAMAELLGSAAMKIQQIKPIRMKNSMAGGGSPNRRDVKKRTVATTAKLANKKRSVLRAPNLFER